MKAECDNLYGWIKKWLHICKNLTKIGEPQVNPREKNGNTEEEEDNSQLNMTDYRHVSMCYSHRPKIGWKIQIDGQTTVN